MNVSVYDTIYKKSNGQMIKFDVIVPSNQTDLEQIYKYANAFLKLENIQASQLISADECNFCHFEVATETILNDINKRGYSVLKHWGF